ncbi:hypothetical protein FQ087_07045 [Sporosarcina sp. ANT_H38]|uniref:hypothetical protein n=1 Tax=Sporosarcina sp. ANT_H38 TaxID=2597358 RepID=UPI0011F156DB|nr:hypothetical protein [Sporosarcina sp. ANT_H38]KAA0966004.1 hypothetical protein FQ087_07045 [Sporosarcina sp. ANT_H38]
MQLAGTMGLRLNEAVEMSGPQVEQALKCGVYQVKNEAGNRKWRQVSLSDQGRHVLLWKFGFPMIH